MTSLLDLVAVVAVVAAILYLLRRPKGGCADCAGAGKPAETRVSIERLRANARRVSGRR